VAGAPFFQTIRVIAAILRARVSRAISGFIPFANQSSVKLLEWPGLDGGNC
jgi:hypothetical protein